MKYYRTTEDCADLAREFIDRFTNRSDLLVFIQEKHNLVELGYFNNTSRYGFWTSQQGLQGQSDSNEFRAAPHVMDFLVNEGPYTDMLLNHTLVLFGRMKDGQIDDIAVLSYAGLLDPSDL